MGSRPSKSISSGEARGSRAQTGHPNEGDQSSNVVMGPLEPILGYEEYQERREWPGYGPLLPGSGFRRRALTTEWFDDEAEGDLDAGADGSQGGVHLEHDMVHDDVAEDDYYSSIGVEGAYCRAAAESHATSVKDGESGGTEVGSAPFGGQGSVMYTYRESSKMRFGTLNIKGSLQGTMGVCCEFKCCLLYVWGCVIISLCFSALRVTRSWPMSYGHLALMESMC